MSARDRVLLEFETDTTYRDGSRNVEGMADEIVDLRRQVATAAKQIRTGGATPAHVLGALHRSFVGDLSVVGFRDEGDGPPTAWDKVATDAEAMRIRMAIHDVERVASYYGVELEPADLEDPKPEVTYAAVRLWQLIDHYAEACGGDLRSGAGGQFIDQIDQAIQLVRNEAITQTLKGKS